MLRCSVAECQLNLGGECFRGLGDECPNVVSVQSGSDGTLSAVGKALHSGAPLTAAEASTILRLGPARVVVLAGLVESGKSSLIARIHQMFLSGDVEGLLFAGSHTLPRFEEMNWLATVESGVPSPQMPRTLRKLDNTFLHFTVRSPKAGRLNILVNDLSGETVEEAIALQSICDDLVALARADHLVVVLDGFALENATSRFHHVAQMRTFLHRVLNKGRLGRRTAVHLVVTKGDQLSTAAEYVESSLREFEEILAGKVATVSRWQVAARPTDGSFPTESEIARLFTSWTTSISWSPEPLTEQPKTPPARDFQLFGSH